MFLILWYELTHKCVVMSCGNVHWATVNTMHWVTFHTVLYFWAFLEFCLYLGAICLVLLFHCWVEHFNFLSWFPTSSWPGLEKRLQKAELRHPVNFPWRLIALCCHSTGATRTMQKLTPIELDHPERHPPKLTDPPRPLQVLTANQKLQVPSIGEWKGQFMHLPPNSSELENQFQTV